MAYCDQRVSRAVRFASVCKTLASGGESAVLARLKRDTRAVLTPQSCAKTHSVLYARVRERTSTGGNQALRLDSVQRNALPQQSTRRRQQGIEQSREHQDAAVLR